MTTSMVFESLIIHAAGAYGFKTIPNLTWKSVLSDASFSLPPFNQDYNASMLLTPFKLYFKACMPTTPNSPTH